MHKCFFFILPTDCRIVPKSSPKVQTENIPIHRHICPKNMNNMKKSNKICYFKVPPKIWIIPHFFSKKLKYLQMWCLNLKVALIELSVMSFQERAIDGWKDGINKPVSCEIGHRASRNRAPPTCKIGHHCNPIMLTKRAGKSKYLQDAKSFHSFWVEITFQKILREIFKPFSFIKAAKMFIY